jgi:hypothetical protein
MGKWLPEHHTLQQGTLQQFYMCIQKLTDLWHRDMEGFMYALKEKQWKHNVLSITQTLLQICAILLAGGMPPDEAVEQNPLSSAVHVVGSNTFFTVQLAQTVMNASIVLLIAVQAYLKYEASLMSMKTSVIGYSAAQAKAAVFMINHFTFKHDPTMAVQCEAAWSQVKQCKDAADDEAASIPVSAVKHAFCAIFQLVLTLRTRLWWTLANFPLKSEAHKIQVLHAIKQLRQRNLDPLVDEAAFSEVANRVGVLCRSLRGTVQENWTGNNDDRAGFAWLGHHTWGQPLTCSRVNAAAMGCFYYIAPWCVTYFCNDHAKGWKFARSKSPTEKHEEAKTSISKKASHSLANRKQIQEKKTKLEVEKLHKKKEKREQIRKTLITKKEEA